MASPNSNLAVVIPAIKIHYLRKTLDSLVAQTDKNFTVYIFDDAGPETIQEISKSFDTQLNIKYYRFEHNLGKTDLVAQWQRCVNLVTDEDWFCLFSDDDLMAPGCVRSFHDALKKTNNSFDVFRFNTAVIDKNDKITTICPETFGPESAVTMAYHLLLGERGNSMPDHIFNRNKFNNNGGFVNFPLGQASDWATSILQGKGQGIYTIAGPLVYWRRSEINISSNAHKNKARGFVGHLKFIQWLAVFFTEKELLENGITKNQFNNALKQNLINITRDHYKGFPLSIIVQTATVIKHLFNLSFLQATSLIIKLNFSLASKNTYISLRRLLHLKDYSVN